MCFVLKGLVLMRKEHHILFPAFLVIFASFLAFNIDDLSAPSVSDIIDSGTITGFSVEGSTAGACGDYDVLGLFSESNSHISTIGSGESVDYCAELSTDLGMDTPTRNCYADNSNVVAYISNGLKISSTFNWPIGIETVVDANSFTTAYVTDTGNDCIRKVSGNGLATHFSGICGTAGYVSGSANTAKFSGPSGIVLVGDYFYVTDRDNHCIRRVSMLDGNVADFAGTCGGSGTEDGAPGVGKFNKPVGITIGPSGFLAVADKDNHCIRKVALTDGNVETIAGECGNSGDVVGVVEADARFEMPTGIAYSSSNDMYYVTDMKNDKIKSIEINAGVLTLASNLGEPYSVVYEGSSNVLYVADSLNQKIKKFDLGSSSMSDYVGDGSPGFLDGSALNSKLNSPRGLDLDGFGNLFITDTQNSAIRVLSSNGFYTLAGINDSIGFDQGTLVGGGHIYAPESASNELPELGYYQRVCYDKVQCSTYAGAVGNQECGGNYCLLSFGEGTYNAHAADCSSYANKLCCEVLVPQSPGTCGNGIVELGETCDDGNTVGGDGCDEFCQNEPFVDTDSDGIEDAEDNCPVNPNSNVLGTCIDVSLLSNHEGNISSFTCVDDTDCSGKTINVNGVDYAVEHCENSQANEDGDSGSTSGDGCGNACDIDSNDRNTCLETGDQGGGSTSECNLALQGASFLWSATSVERGDEVILTLDLASDDRCDSIAFDVDVINEDTQEFSVIKPNPITVVGSSGTTTWFAENNNPGPDADDAKWKAKGYNFGGGVAPPSDVLTVTATNSYCGDNNVNAGEQCDDGNTVSGDGCSDTCLNEGISGPGSGDGCSSYCVRGTAVCTADGVAFCGDYDGDGCNELSNEVSCAAGEVCNADFGNCVASGCNVKNYPDQANPSCPSSGDYAWACGSWTDCNNGERTRICSPCNSGNCASEPLTRVDCSLEPSVKGPVFDMFSWMLAILLLSLFYMFRTRNMKLTVTS
jgi:cysteine-rich repeat protein